AVGGGAFVDTLNRKTGEYQRFFAKTKDIIDWIVIGDGEHVLEHIIDGKIPPERRAISVEELPAELKPSGESSLVPDFSDFNTFKYPYLVVTASSGCPFTCSFCNELQFYGAYRKRAGSKV